MAGTWHYQFHSSFFNGSKSDNDSGIRLTGKYLLRTEPVKQQSVALRNFHETACPKTWQRASKLAEKHNHNSWWSTISSRSGHARAVYQPRYSSGNAWAIQVSWTDFSSFILIFICSYDAAPCELFFAAFKKSDINPRKVPTTKQHF